MVSQGDTPVLLSMADLERAAVVMSEAFQNDPLWQMLLPARGDRDKWLVRVYRAVLCYDIANRHAYGAGSPLEGVAVWRSPGGPHAVLPVVVLARFAGLVPSPLLGTVARAIGVQARMATMRRQHAPHAHHYLESLAVVPAAQGRGVASRLVRRFLLEADHHEAGAYVETATLSNVAMYEHFGFECLEQVTMPRTGLQLWSLYRPAGAGRELQGPA